jgi:hypothetical protein
MLSRVLLVVVLLWFGSGWARADCTWADRSYLWGGGKELRNWLVEYTRRLA